MKTLFKRMGIVLLIVSLFAAGVFAQEETTGASVNTFTFVLVIIGGGIAVVAALGFFMRDTNGSSDNKSE